MPRSQALFIPSNFPRLARALDLDRKPVRKYREWAATQHLLGSEPLPDLAALHT